MHSPAASREAISHRADSLMRSHLLRATLIFVLLASACGDGRPSASDLRDSFAAQLVANRFVSNVQPDGDTITFSGLSAGGGAGAWRIVIDSAEVEPNDDPSLPYQGTITSSSLSDGQLRPTVGSRVQLTGGTHQQRPGAGMLRPSGTAPRRDGNGSRRGNAVPGQLAPRRFSIARRASTPRWPNGSLPGMSNGAGACHPRSSRWKYPCRARHYKDAALFRTSSVRQHVLGGSSLSVRNLLWSSQ